MLKHLLDKVPMVCNDFWQKYCMYSRKYKAITFMSKSSSKKTPHEGEKTDKPCLELTYCFFATLSRKRLQWQDSVYSLSSSASAIAAETRFLIKSRSA